jgi:hypothetical protein
MIGLALCVLAGEVKIPALIGVVFIGWWWGEAESSRRRILRMAIALSTAAGLTALVSVALRSRLAVARRPVRSRRSSSPGWIPPARWVSR